ncbi:uroporphyrinogen-III synthase [Trichophyton tonsurans CBS 112818]|uniref:Uroporphyrinogen-III synthase n=1 Tax=Trichophyton tonsurans (strain CBS 112818) TaxID=647933 RepID=F2RQ54_TRIT1|nr:uroporphyrinogen-III synthase [Trichophyton tonsurans CBS 112818]
MSLLPVTKGIPIYFLKTNPTPHDGYEEYFSPSKGFKPCFIPVLEHKFNHNNLQKVKDLILSGAVAKQYGGIIFTSQRAVEGFSRMVQDEVGKNHTVTLSHSLSFYSVGPATYRSLKSLCDVYFPHSQVIGEEAGTGEKLSGLILAHYNGLQRNTSDENGPSGGIRKKLPLLFLVGEQHRDIIPKTLMSPSLDEEERIGVVTMVVYETGVMESFGQDFVAALKKEEQANNANISAGNMSPHKQLIWVVVFSPSGLQPPGKNRTSSRWPRFDCRIATIGPTTRDHLVSNFAVQPDVCAEKPSPDGLWEGIEPIIEEWKRSREQDR